MLLEKTTILADTNKHSHIHLSAFTADELKQALLASNDEMTPLEGMVATTEAAFEFIRNSSLETAEKNAFYQLEKQFEFYKELLGAK